MLRQILGKELQNDSSTGSVSLTVDCDIMSTFREGEPIIDMCAYIGHVGAVFGEAAVVIAVLSTIEFAFEVVITGRAFRVA